MVFMTHNQNPTNPTCASATISQGNLLHGSWEQMSSIKWACWFGSLFFFWEINGNQNPLGIHQQWEINGKSMGFINKIRSQPTKRESNGDFIQTRDANTDDGWLVPLKCDMSGGFKDIFVILILGGDDIWRRRSLSDSYLHLMKTIHALPNTTANVFAL